MATSRPRLLVPGLVPRDPGRETYRVRPGEVTVVSLRPDDRVTVRDIHGGQRAEVSAVTSDGRSAQAELGLGGRGEVAELFGSTSPPGAEETFRAERDVVVSVSAPTGRPVIEGGVPASDLQLEIARARPDVENTGPFLPDPLADPRLDFQVDRASALAYEVKAGEFIQVIDVQGRQCSDFLAFSAPRLQEGKERGLDATATRSLTGVAYPSPGLHSTFFDHDLEPLVEVVRDTVGRHDAFGLACTARYYEDMGYFGHVNCSDNFNAELLPYTIEPRKGWPAINFFYNTAFDVHNQYVLDEPWSRPGDYVLLKAMTDLVYLAIACDIARSINLMYTHSGSFLAANRVTESQVKTNMHELGHNGAKAYPDLADAYAWHTRHFARLVSKLRATRTPEGTLLDQSALVMVTEAGYGDDHPGDGAYSHSTQNMVALLAGRAGDHKPGRHLAMGNAVHPLGVIVSAMRMVGVPGAVGEVNAPVPDLFA